MMITVGDVSGKSNDTYSVSCQMQVQANTIVSQYDSDTSDTAEVGTADPDSTLSFA